MLTSIDLDDKYDEIIALGYVSLEDFYDLDENEIKSFKLKKPELKKFLKKINEMKQNED